jgi:hypothetical protein
MSPSNAPIRPSWWWCCLGVLVILLGFASFCYTLIHDLPALTGSLTQLVAPGQKDLTLEPDRTYTIFLEQQPVVNGQIYSTENVQSLNCAVRSVPSDVNVQLRQPAMTTSYSFGARQGKSVLEFNTFDGTTYHVSCVYGPGEQGPPTVLAIGTGITEKIFGLVFKALAAIFGGMGLGGCIILVVLLMRHSSKKRLSVRAPTQAS